MAFDPNQPRDKLGRWSAVGAYISETGFEINESLRRNEIDSETKNVVDQLDGIIDAQGVVYGGTLYRGANEDVTNILQDQAGVGSLEIGEDYTEQFAGLEIQDAAFVSTSRNSAVAEEFASRGAGIGVVFEINSKKVASLNVSDVMGDDVDWQEENIFARNTSFLITSAWVDATPAGAVVLILGADAK